MNKLLEWFGFGGGASAVHGGHGHSHGDDGGHGHTHGVMDATIATTSRGIWAIKWSFAILAVTAVLQLVVVAISGSVALLADTIHNIGDAATAIPLWVAFVLARRKPSARFTYGLGKVEDVAGVLIVAIILFSAVFAGYEAIHRLINPQPIDNLLWVAIAGVVGFIGNEVVAVFRIRVGREINSAALIADGYHARTDGLTSLAVVAGAIGVWLGFPLADPIVGLIITIAILGIVWQSAGSVFTRMLDGLEPGTLEEIRHTAEHVPGIRSMPDVRARWHGHKLHAEIAIEVDPNLSLQEAQAIAEKLRDELFAHMPALTIVNIRFEHAAPDDARNLTPAKRRGHGHAGHGHHHAPKPFAFDNAMAQGTLEIVDTAQGERMRLRLLRAPLTLTARVVIQRPEGLEVLVLEPTVGAARTYQSLVAPAEPHEFDAVLTLDDGGEAIDLHFHMAEPAHHHH